MYVHGKKSYFFLLYLLRRWLFHVVVIFSWKKRQSLSLIRKISAIDNSNLSLSIPPPPPKAVICFYSHWMNPESLPSVADSVIAFPDCYCKIVEHTAGRYIPCLSHHLSLVGKATNITHCHSRFYGKSPSTKVIFRSVAQNINSTLIIVFMGLKLFKTLKFFKVLLFYTFLHVLKSNSYWLNIFVHWEYYM